MDGQLHLVAHNGVCNFFSSNIAACVLVFTRFMHFGWLKLPAMGTSMCQNRKQVQPRQVVPKAH